MFTLTPSVLRYGSDTPLPERIPLRAGPLSLLYENGDLRSIRLGSHEIIRRIYAAVRDRNWGTVPPHIHDVQMQVEPDHFRIRYIVDNREGDIDFGWVGTIAGEADGTITFNFDGEARSTFLRNRIGFCVLHPTSVAGAAARILHVDGGMDEDAFPRRVAPQLHINGLPAPHQPFADMTMLAHEVTPGVWAELRFEGDVFEMEDQRNWTDGSYKTYCTPLQLGFPVEVPAGTRIVQTITLRLIGGTPQTAAADKWQPVTVTWQHDTRPLPLPPLGLGVASQGKALSPREIERLKALRLSHLRVDVKPSQPGWEAALARAAGDTNALGVGLEIALTLSENAADEARAVRAVLKQTEARVFAWLVYSDRDMVTPLPALEAARAALHNVAPDAPFVAGTDANFAELNRDEPPLAHTDVVSFSANPQVHAFDNASLAETPEALRAVIVSGREKFGKPIALTPLTLKQRFNPVATAAEPPPPPGELPKQVDTRQMSLFGAGWTLASLKHAAEANALAYATLFETTGWRGVMSTEAGSPLPERFPALPGCVFPIYHVLADIAAFRDGGVLPAHSDDALRVEAMALSQGDAVRVLLANMTHEAQTVRVIHAGSAPRLRVLEDTNAEDAMCSPEAWRASEDATCEPTGEHVEVTLPPYALARLDFA